MICSKKYGPGDIIDYLLKNEDFDESDFYGMES